MFSFFANSQQIGTWRLHFDYSNVKDIAASNKRILAATEKAILSYELDNSTTQDLRKLDKTNSLSDIGISCIDYCEDEKTFIIAYNSTNIDLLTDNLELTNIPDIKNKNISTSKNINDIFIYKSSAYFSTDLGIIVLDIKNQEIDNTYIIGNYGDPESVLDCTIFKDTVYALTKTQGIKVAPLEGQNLLDFSTWENISMPFPANVTKLESFKGALFLMASEKIYKKENYLFNEIFSEPNSIIKSLTASEKLISVIDSAGVQTKLLVIDESKTDTIRDDKTSQAVKAIEINNKLFVADKSWGLMNYEKNEFLTPSGPFSNEIQSFSSRKDKIFASPGTLGSGINAGYNYSGFYYFQNNNWNNVNRYIIDGLDNVINFIDVKENPINNKVYSATTTGLVVYDYESIFVYDTTNSLLEKQIGSGENIYVVGIDFDSKGNTWMTNSHTNTPLKVLTADGNWYKYSLITGGATQKYYRIFVDSYDQIWVYTFRKGIALFPKIEDYSANHNNSSIVLNTSTANLPHNTINIIVEDKNGAIWVGTNQGIGVFDCPEDIFETNSDCIISRRIKSTLGEYTEYLFDTDVVNSIAVDGANRKWIGTDAGLWLISENGDEIIETFNTENSPLPTNEIISIAIQEQTGEVFIGTREGMISYIGDATEPAEDLSNIKAFPNPVKPNYYGTISITGLVANSFIKITDINGTLIDDGYALGGKYVWNGKDYNGRRASSGIYLVFSSDSKSKQKAVAKIVFIN